VTGQYQTDEYTLQATKQVDAWEKKAWHVSHERFACEADARQAATRMLGELPAWMTSTVEVRMAALPRPSGVSATSTRRGESRAARAAPARLRAY